MANWIKRWIERRQEKRAIDEQLRLEAEAIADRAGELSMNQYLDQYLEIAALSTEEAKQRFFDGVDTGQLAVEYAAPDNLRVLAALPETLRDLFSKVANIVECETGYVIDRNDFQLPAPPPPGFMSLGYFPTVLVHPPEDDIYVLEEAEGEERLLRMEPNYPTIYHYLLSKSF